MASDWIQTYTGKKFYPLDPRVEDVDIEDIAHALSNLCRFTGHCSSFYSVAQHSWHVSKQVPQENALAGLLHDAPEAYLNDIARPVKNDILMAEYRLAELRLAQVIAEKFELDWPLPATVKEADNRMLATERRDLMKKVEWTSHNYEPYAFEISSWTPHVAKMQFLMRFNQCPVIQDSTLS